MAGEQVEGLPDALREWVESRAEATDRPPEEVLARAVAAYRLIDEYEGSFPAPATLADDAAVAGGEGGADASALADRVAELEARIEALDADLDEKIDDVRDRVVQVKRETDAKAPADHGHPELESAAETASELSETVAELAADLADLESTFEAGFANYEEVLEYLTDTAEDHDAKLSTVGSVLADVRSRVSSLERHAERRAAAAELQAEANRLGIEAADCSACGSRVRLGLLSTPECPHCGEPFGSIEPAPGLGFLRSPSLVVGDRPALEGETADRADEADVEDPADVFADEGE